MGRPRRAFSPEQVADLAALTLRDFSRKWRIPRETARVERLRIGIPSPPRGFERQPETAPPGLDERARRARDDAQRKADIATLRNLLSASARQAAYTEAIRSAAPLVDLPPLIAPAPAAGQPVHTWVLALSDWHIGQKTESEHTGRVFAQTTEITAGQVRALWTKLERIAAAAEPSIAVDEIVLLVLGDIVDGDGLRASQARGIDLLVTQQTIEATKLLGWLIRQCATRFPHVRVHVVGGNHDRTSSKPSYGGLGELGYEDTYAWLIGKFLELQFEPLIAAGRLVMTTHDSFWGADVIAGRRFVFEHGASFKASTGSYGGVGYYGLVNAARGYGEMLGGADFVVMGHFHTAMLLPHGPDGWQIMNGALPPSSPFVQARYRKINRPTQVLLDLHPEHGLVDYRPIYLDHAEMLRPGDFWRTLAPSGA